MRLKRFNLAQSRRSIDRYALHIDIPWDQQTPQQRKLAKKIPSIFQKLNERVADLITQISLPAEKTLISVRLLDRAGNPINGSLGAHIMKWGEAEAPFVRAFVSSLDIEDTSPAANVDTSHLVQIEISRNKYGWYSGGPTAHAIVRTTADKWPQLIEDILLDICMYHSFPDRRQRLDVDRAVADGTFAPQKVKFVTGLQKDSFYGPIVEPPRYLAISSFCRYSEQIDVDAYVRNWSMFLSNLKTLRSGGTHAAAVASTEPTPAHADIRYIVRHTDATVEYGGREVGPRIDVVREILSKHRKGPQINARKLEKLIKDLPRGSYFLLRTERKPRRAIAVTQLSFLFGPGIWKIGKMKVVPVGDLPKYKEFNPYISILRFEVPRQ